MKLSSINKHLFISTTLFQLLATTVITLNAEELQSKDSPEYTGAKNFLELSSPTKDKAIRALEGTQLDVNRNHAMMGTTKECPTRTSKIEQTLRHNNVP